jgi:hypothetical protein
MFRRACLYLLPVFFALVFLAGTPASSTAGQEASAAPPTLGTVLAPFTHRNLGQEIPDAIVSLGTDQDEASDDGVLLVVVMIDWPEVAFEASFACQTTVVGSSHRPCAAPPRAPPIA